MDYPVSKSSLPYHPRLCRMPSKLKVEKSTPKCASVIILGESFLDFS